MPYEKKAQWKRNRGRHLLVPTSPSLPNNHQADHNQNNTTTTTTTIQTSFRKQRSPVSGVKPTQLTKSPAHKSAADYLCGLHPFSTFWNSGRIAHHQSLIQMIYCEAMCVNKIFSTWVTYGWGLAILPCPEQPQPLITMIILGTKK